MPEFRPGSVDYEKQAANFTKGRALSAASWEAWRLAFQRHLLAEAPSRILDLGSGTGRYSPLLAEWFGCRVVGVEPSAGMRSAAMREHSHPRVDYLGGDAQAIPLADGSCDAALLAFVIHHVPDREQCARELARVLRPGGLALVTGGYSERRERLTLFRYFPAALKIARGFVKAPQIAQDLASAGLSLIADEAVTTETAGSLREAADRTRLRADSTLQLINDAEFEAGQRALEEAAAQETDPRPITSTLDLLVFRRPA